ncbi:MAG: DinB family protein [Rhodothermales bacterium]|nr:DinB family protein [Rhodothermales bacterium]MBO6778945.1 DinB family protein [Rhodothermales bacterium]
MSTTIARLTKLHGELARTYAHMEDLLQREDDSLFKLAPAVSGWSVANQLHHTAGATALMLVAVDRIAKQKSPAQEGGTINAIGRAVLFSRRMPRGRAKAPQRTVPPESFAREDLEVAVARSRRVYDSIPETFELAAPSAWRTEHPYFGWMGPDQWMKLAIVHADHHFAIIREIDGA